MPTQIAFTNSDLGGIALHCLFMLMIGIGLLLLIVWMIKHLNAKQMLTLGLVLFLAGLIGGALTFRMHWDLMNKYYNNSRGGVAVPRTDLLPSGGAIMNNQ